MLTRQRCGTRGVTLIELMVTLTLVGLLMMLALPSYGSWTRNARVRTVSEEVLNGLRRAQAEAVARNRQVAFVRTNLTPGRDKTPASDGRNWFVQVLPINTNEAADTTFISNSFVAGGAFTTNDAAAVAGNSIVCFNSVGRVVDRADTGGLSTACVAPTSATDPLDINVTLTGSRFETTGTAMRVEVFLGGRLRLCKADAASTQPNACTP